MNWYKKSQANIIYPEEHDEHYLEFGHENNKEDEIWIWDQGRLFTDSGYSSHGRLANQLENSGQLDFTYLSRSLFDPPVRSNVQTRYGGRFENRDGKKMVSIKPSARMHFHKISPQLIRDLQTEYGSDIEIYTFE